MDRKFLILVLAAMACHIVIIGAKRELSNIFPTLHLFFAMLTQGMIAWYLFQYMRKQLMASFEIDTGIRTGKTSAKLLLQGPQRTEAEIRKNRVIGAMCGLLLAILVFAYHRFIVMDHSASRYFQGGFHAYMILPMITIILGTPLIEEFYFRAILIDSISRFESPGQSGLKNRESNVWVALILSTLAFVLVHDLSVAPVLAPVGIAFGLLYLHGGINSSFTAHATYNGIIFFSGFL